MSTLPIVRNLFAVAALCVLTACGFHLRNQSALPSALQPIFIGGPASGGALAGALRYQLRSSDTNVTSNAGKANYRLILLGESQEQRIISLDRRGLAAEYGLISSVEFELQDRNGQRVLGPLSLQELRTVTNNPDNALTTSQEVVLVRTDINKALAALVVRRLGAYANHLPVPATSTTSEVPVAPGQISAPAPASTAPSTAAPAP
jgi:LPS-assembly lipoprotein